MSNRIGEDKDERITETLAYSTGNIYNLGDCRSGSRIAAGWAHPTQLEELIKSRIALGVLVAVIFLPGVITYLKWWSRVGWKDPTNLRDLRLLLPPALALLILLLIFLFTGMPPTRMLMLVIINTLMVGISEELMFRGILFHGASSSFGTWRAV